MRRDHFLTEAATKTNLHIFPHLNAFFSSSPLFSFSCLGMISPVKSQRGREKTRVQSSTRLSSFLSFERKICNGPPPLVTIAVKKKKERKKSSKEFGGRNRKPYKEKKNASSPRIASLTLVSGPAPALSSLPVALCPLGPAGTGTVVAAVAPLAPGAGEPGRAVAGGDAGGGGEQAGAAVLAVGGGGSRARVVGRGGRHLFIIKKRGKK